MMVNKEQIFEFRFTVATPYLKFLDQFKAKAWHDNNVSMYSSLTIYQV